MGIHTSIQWCDSTLSNDRSEDRFWMLSRKAVHQSTRPGNSGGIERFARQLDEALRWPDLHWTIREQKPWLNRSRRLVLINGIGDPFSDTLASAWLAPYLDRMAESEHIWLFLTKESTRMREFFQEHEVPQNFWLGISVSGPDDVALADELWRIPNVVVPWICAEPLLGPIDISKYAVPQCIDNGTFDSDDHECDLCNRYNGLAWVVAGIGKGTIAGPHELSWLRAIRDQCSSNGASLFLTTCGREPVSRSVERDLETVDNDWRKVPLPFEYRRTDDDGRLARASFCFL